MAAAQLFESYNPDLFEATQGFGDSVIESSQWPVDTNHGPSTSANQRRPLGKHLLLSASYGLNNSDTKKIATGIALMDSGSFETVVKIVGSGSNEIILSATAWNIFARDFDNTARYFSYDHWDDEQHWGYPMELEGCSVTYGRAHDAKAIIFELPENRRQDQPSQDPDHDEVRAGTQEPSAKRRKVFSPKVIMQEVTFQGLVRVSPIVDAQLERLKQSANALNKSKGLIVKNIASGIRFLGREDLSVEAIADIVLERFDSVTENIRKHSKPTFGKTFYQIALLELKILFVNELAAEIKKILWN